MLHLAYQVLNYDNPQPTTHFVKLFVKHLDLPLSVKRLLTHKLTQKVLPWLSYAWRCDVAIMLLTRRHATSWDSPRPFS
jgi:hypothetical protein